MSFQVAYYFAAFAIILTHSTIVSVKGQCTVQGCDNGDPSINIVAEIQQLRVELFDHVNKQDQNMQDLLIAAFQQITSQHEAITRSLQAVDRRFQEHDICIKQVQSIHEILNESVQQTKSQHDTVMMSIQAADRRSQENNIYIKQGQSIHELLNETFQEMKSQHGTVMTSLQGVERLPKEHAICVKQIQSIHELLNESLPEMKSQLDAILISHSAVDRQRSQEHDVNIKQVQSIHALLNESFQDMKSLQEVGRSQEHDICIKQFQSINELVNESVQQTKSQHDTVMNRIQEVDRRSQENSVYIKEVPSIHALLNESFQEMKSQHDTVNMSLQAVDRRLQNYQIDIKNQTQTSWKLVNDICGPVSPVRDCSDIKASGQNASGVYEVCVGHQLNRVCTNAFCDMETNNSAWLVFQRRKDGSVNFNRTWAGYKQGFGDRNGEFWLGNEMLYLLTSKRNYKLRVDLEDFEGRKGYAEYARFSINSSDDNYRLTVSGYSGTAGNSLSVSNGQQFSTDDVNNDNCGSTNCARTHGGAWWHPCCSYATLNGKYYHRYDTVIYRTGIHWLHWHNSMDISLKATEMKLVPVA